MNVVSVIGITLLAAAVLMSDRRNWSRRSWKERAAFAAITALGWAIAVLLVFVPELPGPTQLVESIFGPLGKSLE
ncbi:hypothetical protein [Paenibacillus sp. GYB003]|uniref:hypothetical protein n=1 Tax=Paenibacillus sp. GYB003 TaxID=2994392 RepID=UPI002F964EBC